MQSVKIFVTLDQKTVQRMDVLIEQCSISDRSHLVEAALREKLRRLSGDRLARECAKLEPAEEKALAEEGRACGLVRRPQS